MNNQLFYLHHRYDEFKAFLDSVKTDARINPNALNLAFDVWLKTKTDNMLENMDVAVFGGEQSELIVKLKADLDRLHRERDSFQRQASVLAEEVERLNELFLVGFGYAIGERGEVCLSIDCGNL